ncbi:GIY-YIG nuclease family protein [Prosthecodimorpha staleyi]|uniref:GIY-YIG nuclease family protein n=1 Tax=Prosthecodimorpha staleyi TaxID=2840188 RepID=A0A947D929_9HYPH|nr:GIY-YIG nuclease family protein [Prosthecodimorpha staleyi]MBT9292960.1 GIY-YIG nuclease family protein [Prosthecodimorpha staleyi]
MNAWVYILASRPDGALFVGTAEDLVGRVYHHRARVPAGFSLGHAMQRLVWYAAFDRVEAAMAFARDLRRRHRHAKVRIIEAMNPDWDDLYPEVS